MSGRAVEASAPLRVPLAGDLLDEWPLDRIESSPVTVSASIDRRVWCRIELGGQAVRIESKDALRVVEGGDLDAAAARGAPPAIASLLRALDLQAGVRLVTQAKVPAGSGLGVGPALALAVAAAATRALGRELPMDGLCALVRRACAQAAGRPVGAHAAYAACHGGLLALHLEPGGVRAELLPADPGRVEECLALVGPGAGADGPEPAAPSWEALKRRADGDAEVARALMEAASLGARLRAAVLARAEDQVVGLWAAEAAASRVLAQGWSAEAERVAALAAAAGAAARPCAAGRGVVAVWAPPGPRGPGVREVVEAAVKDAGLALLRLRLDLRGLEVEEAS